MRVTSGVFEPICGQPFQAKRWNRPALPFLSRIRFRAPRADMFRDTVRLQRPSRQPKRTEILAVMCTYWRPKEERSRWSGERNG